MFCDKRSSANCLDAGVARSPNPWTKNCNGEFFQTCDLTLMIFQNESDSVTGEETSQQKAVEESPSFLPPADGSFQANAGQCCLLFRIGDDGAVLSITYRLAG